MPTFTKRGLCEKCNEPAHLAYSDHADEYWCDNCLSSDAEAAWERHCAAFHDGGDTSFIPLYQQQLATRKLK